MKRLLVLVACALCACDPAVTGAWRGPPLVTLSGQLSLKEGLTLDRGVRLAIAWYPDIAAEVPKKPRFILTEELEYTGMFPQRFTFPLFAAPPREAMGIFTKEDGASSEAAVGQLFAYEDVDGDGRLTVDADGRSSDRILGSTAGAGPFDFFSSEPRDVVAWASTADALGLEEQGATAGYNLLRFTSPLRPPEVLPLATPIPLVLTGEPRLSLIVCPEAYGEEEAEVACGVTVWSTPAVSGTISLREDGALDAFVSVPKGARSVTVNGTALEADALGEVFTFAEAASNVLRTGVNTVVVDAPGFQPLTLEAVVPTRFDVLNPLPDAELKAGSELKADWTQAVGATAYSVSISSFEFTDSTLTDAVGVKLRVPDQVGPGMFDVTAFDRVTFTARSAVNGLTTRTVPVQIVP